MSYRDDLEAARHRREALTRELADVRRRLGDRDTLEAEERLLAAELAETARNIDQARARLALPLLQQVRVASPCTQRWDDMKGDDRVRFCAGCEQNVYDLSAMTATEAETLLTARGERMCVRFYRRTDGTVLTSDCPDGARRRRTRRIVAGAAALLAGGMAAGVAARALASPERAPVVEVPEPRPMMGAVALDPGPRHAPPHARAPAREPDPGDVDGAPPTDYEMGQRAR